MTDTEISTAASIEQTQLTNESAAPVSTTVTEQSTTEQPRHERTYTRDELAKITNAESKKFYEKGKTEALEAYRKEQEVKQQSIANVTQNPVVNPQLNDEELANRIEKIAQQKAYQNALQNEAQSFHAKLDLENDVEMKLNYEKLNLGKMTYPECMPYIHTLNSVDNTKDVIKEFAKFPEKLTTIFNTINMFGLDAGKEALRRVSESIKRNQVAAEIKLPGAPPSQITASNTGSDNGQMTTADFRKMYANKF